MSVICYFTVCAVPILLYRHQVASVVPAITLGKQLNSKQCMVGTYRNKVSPGCFHPWLAIQVVCMVWQWPIRTLFRTKTGTHLSVMCHFEHSTIKWRVVHFPSSFWEDNPTILYYDIIGALSCWKEADRKSTRLNSSHMSESRMPSSAWKKKKK